ncbi:pyridoxamine 5'-phosphate oxidase family protein [Methanofollis tationis]|uniref:Pyridoxamine 5'-phosphate oxidase family protein n=1 Tax=Methanofollis tationis TaxID=81417 RepID=A0A7K4HQD8_9EURY|nr:pyridoxamine 5'-phosphate oxidase family protein [Methanofollis tationis]NVO67485.1 pyridoxamine 5'-phosphate oxidase family protein [Methanofollis tationis]
MRRNDREITDRAWMEAVLNDAVYATFALCDGDEPYAVPLNFAYLDGALYVHSAREGRKVNVMRKNSSVGFSVVVGVDITSDEAPCAWDMRYRSVNGVGTAEAVEDPAEKAWALNLIAAKYSRTGCNVFTEKQLAAVAVFRIRVRSLAGKRGMD